MGGNKTVTYCLAQAEEKALHQGSLSSVHTTGDFTFFAWNEMVQSSPASFAHCFTISDNSCWSVIEPVNLWVKGHSDTTSE